jgi:DnaJ-class molecular chaperone
MIRLRIEGQENDGGTVERCPWCRGPGIRFREPVATLAVVREFPTLHAFGDQATASVLCRPCKGKGRMTRAAIREERAKA